MNRCAALGLLVLGCGPPQWAIHIGTDADVPQFGDRLYIEVMDSKGPLAQRLVGVGERTEWPVSFGMAADADRGLPLYVRARLYRADHATGTGLPAVSYLDGLGRVPELSGRSDVGLRLSLSCFGVASDATLPGRTCDPVTGTLAPVPMLSAGDDVPRPGTWPQGQRVECSVAPPEEMVCIPGGVFMLGGNRYFPIRDILAPRPERLVRLSPFALDRDEFTVADYYRLRQQHSDLLAPYARVNDPTHIQHPCTFLGTEADQASPLPVNCVPEVLAAQACALMGKRLPTEAEWEYAAGNLGRETPWPWGDEDDYCNRAVVGRGRASLEYPTDLDDTSCRTWGGGMVQPWGPVAGGHPSDVTLNGIRNLGGNLAEWVEPGFGSYGDPCWQPERIWLDNPHCRTPLAEYRTYLPRRGGSWQAYPFYAQVVQRGAMIGGAAGDLGFRCAKSL